MIRAILGLFVPAFRRVQFIPSVALSSYPRRTHLQIERGEPFVFRLGTSSFYVTIPPLTVDQVTRLAEFQATIRGQYRAVVDAVDKKPETIRLGNTLKVMFYRSMVGWFYDLSSGSIPWIRRRAYRKALFRFMEDNILQGYKILDHLIKFNSEVDSFFFEIPRKPDGTVQPPVRDGWRTIGFGDDQTGGRGLLSAPILKIFDGIIHRLEQDTIDRMNREKSEAEQKGS